MIVIISNNADQSTSDVIDWLLCYEKKFIRINETDEIKTCSIDIDNTCLNRKICIDAEGNIKNYPAMAKSYGNIKDTTLEGPSTSQDSRICGTSARSRLMSARTASSAICVLTAAASSKIWTTSTPSPQNAPTTPTSACGKVKRAMCPWRSAARTPGRLVLCQTRRGLPN